MSKVSMNALYKEVCRPISTVVSLAGSEEKRNKQELKMSKFQQRQLTIRKTYSSRMSSFKQSSDNVEMDQLFEFVNKVKQHAGRTEEKIGIDHMKNEFKRMKKSSQELLNSNKSSQPAKPNFRSLLKKHDSGLQLSRLLDKLDKMEVKTAMKETILSNVGGASYGQNAKETTDKIRDIANERYKIVENSAVQKLTTKEGTMLNQLEKKKVFEKVKNVRHLSNLK